MCRQSGTNTLRVLRALLGDQVTAEGPVHLKLEAHGTATIEPVEILRHSPSDKTFRVISSFNPGKLDFSWEGTDEGFRQDFIYYVRLR